MEKKKIFIVGVGAQGSAVAQYLDSNPMVSEIICADRDENAVNERVRRLKKGRGIVVDASDEESIAAVAKDVDLVVNAIPGELMIHTLKAAAAAKTNYQDFVAPYGEFADNDLEAYGLFIDKYDPIFKANGKTALVNTGASPGITNLVARHTMRYLDTCHTIKVLYHEGLRTKRFIPFWFSPESALFCMANPGWAYVDGKLIKTKPYEPALYRDWPELGRTTAFYEHFHNEPTTFAYYSKEYYKGVKNGYFKYGGVGMEFAKPLYDLGLLSMEPEEIDGVKIVPFKVIAGHLPPTPKFTDEIKAIIEEGIIEENSAAVVESTGMKDGKEIMVEAHINSPGLVESFERAGLSAEMYQTGLGGAIFARMLIEGKFADSGVFATDTVSFDQVDCYFEYAKELGHTFEVKICDPVEGDLPVIQFTE